jgi:hypothetical protein
MSGLLSGEGGSEMSFPNNREAVALFDATERLVDLPTWGNWHWRLPDLLDTIASKFFTIAYTRQNPLVALTTDGVEREM